jgi:hypothetical protein
MELERSRREPLGIPGVVVEPATAIHSSSDLVTDLEAVFLLTLSTLTFVFLYVLVVAIVSFSVDASFDLSICKFCAQVYREFSPYCAQFFGGIDGCIICMSVHAGMLLCSCLIVALFPVSCSLSYQ